MRSIAALLVLLIAGHAWAGEMTREDLIRQLRASDALAQVLEKPAGQQMPATAPAKKQAYDQLLRKLMADLPEASPGDFADLNEYQLRTAIAMLHQGNLEVYVKLPAKAAGDLAERARQAAGRGRSQALERYLAACEQTSAPPPGLLEAGEAGYGPDRSPVRSPDDTLRAVLSGGLVQRAPMRPSAIAPTDARVRGTQPIEAVDVRTLPLPSHNPGSLPLRADPEDSDIAPSREEVSRVASVLGVDPDTAEQLVMGRISLSDIRQGRGAFVNQRELLGGLTVNDPRWREFYYGPNQWIRTFQVDSRASFEFSTGGGRYESHDRRVNRDFDMRTMGDLDRRVNIINDRRLDSRDDPRVNY